jgi:hypothetical protein
MNQITNSMYHSEWNRKQDAESLCCQSNIFEPTKFLLIIFIN